MSQGVLDLIQAIDSGDSLAIESAFNAEMATRVSEKLEDMRTDVAQNMFSEQTEEVEELSEEQIMDELINEVLGKNAEAGDWIKDFVSSDDPKFAGKSKDKRKEMALAAYYAKQKNEEVDVAELLDYLSENEEVLAELSKATLGSYAKKANDDKEEHEDELDSAKMNNDKETAAYDRKRIAKRKAGISTALNKLAK
jgi:hypothetical protein